MENNKFIKNNINDEIEFNNINKAKKFIVRQKEYVANNKDEYILLINIYIRLKNN